MTQVVEEGGEGGCHSECGRRARLPELRTDNLHPLSPESLGLINDLYIHKVRYITPRSGGSHSKSGSSVTLL